MCRAGHRMAYSGRCLLDFSYHASVRNGTDHGAPTAARPPGGPRRTAHDKIWTVDSSPSRLSERPPGRRAAACSPRAGHTRRRPLVDWFGGLQEYVHENQTANETSNETLNQAAAAFWSFFARLWWPFCFARAHGVRPKASSRCIAAPALTSRSAHAVCPSLHASWSAVRSSDAG